MKFNNRVSVTGMKPSKGIMENGLAYDSTKVYVMTELDASKGAGAGSATVEYNFGLSDNFPIHKHIFASGRAVLCDVDFEQVTNGKTSKTVIYGLVPVPTSASATKV